MTFIALFDMVAEYVADQGLKVTYKRGKRLTLATIKTVRRKSVIPIPDELAEFYAEVGDGVSFHWSSKEEAGPFARIEFPKLSQVVIKSLEQVNWRIEWTDTDDFQYTDDPRRAKKTALRMRKWLPFHDEGNNDRFCFDTAIKRSPVVFDEHDWMDGGTGDNGHRLGESLLAFYTAWSRVCFQYPSNLWWPRVFRKRAGVNWGSEEFQKPFRLPRSR